MLKGYFTYYLKAEFLTAGALSKTTEKFKALLSDTMELDRKWMKIRPDAYKDAKRLKRLLTKHPLAGELIKYIKFKNPDKRIIQFFNNYIPKVREDYRLIVDPEMLRFYMECMLYSISSWDALVDWLLDNGAFKAGCVSDGIEPAHFDIIEMRSKNESMRQNLYGHSVRLSPLDEGGGEWFAEAPAVGCTAKGTTPSEALENITDAIHRYMYESGRVESLEEPE